MSELVSCDGFIVEIKLLFMVIVWEITRMVLRNMNLRQYWKNHENVITAYRTDLIESNDPTKYLLKWKTHRKQPNYISDLDYFHEFTIFIIIFKIITGIAE